MKEFYLIRHCEATGQAPDAPLTQRGHEQAERLAALLMKQGIDHIVSSPYRRAVDSIRPFSLYSGVPIRMEERLRERLLSTVPLPDWREKLKKSFAEPDIRYEGGESTREATDRAIAVLAEAEKRDGNATALVTHGALLALMLHHFDASFGFEGWAGLTNPDVFRLRLHADERHKVHFTRIGKGVCE